MLAKSHRLKTIFYHISVSPTALRMERDFESHLLSVQNLRILDIGCGRGKQSLELIKQGGLVTGIDISPTYIEEASKSAKAMGIGEERCAFKTMDVHSMSFPSKTFDLVIGRGILHHLDLQTALLAVHQVLKTDGRAVFLEPLAGNPLLKLFRLLTPQARTPDEQPLGSKDLRMIQNSWRAQTLYYGLVSAPTAVLTSLLLRPFSNNVLLRIADRLERTVNRIALLRPLNQYVLLILRPQ